LKDAMDGFGTNESDIIAVLTRNCNLQRLQIVETYKQMYGEELMDDLKSELGGDFETVCLALLYSPRAYDAHEIHRAIEGAGTAEKTLIEIMATRNNEEIEEIKFIYQEKYGNALEDDLAGDTSGNFCRFLVALCTANRDDDWCTNKDMAVEDAQRIYDAGEGQCGTDESEFNAFLCRRTLPQIAETLIAYAELTGNDLREVVESETSGALQEGYLAILDASIDMQKFFADRIFESMAGFGTSDHDLIRLIVSRSEVDLALIKASFSDAYDVCIYEKVDSECSGNYKKVLMGILGD